MFSFEGYLMFPKKVTGKVRYINNIHANRWCLLEGSDSELDLELPPRFRETHILAISCPP